MIKNKILEDIMQSVESQFQLTINAITEIQRGWLNLKWKINTNHGVFLVKQYNKDRFNKYNPESLQYALGQQQVLYTNGVPCSQILTSQGEFFQISEDGERYIVMDFCEGEVLKPDFILEEHMYDLGKATGLMHTLLNPTCKIKQPQFKMPTVEARLDHWDTVIRNTEARGKEQLIPIIELQRKVTAQIILDEFVSCQTGWSHRDLWTDNLLFKEKSLSAILDFDRLNYDYLELDIARAIASCTLQDGQFYPSLVKAFLKGYRMNRELPNGMLKRSLKLLWFMESSWWIDEKMDELNPSAKRFAQEMEWLATTILHDQFPLEE